MWNVFFCVTLCVSLVSASCPKDCRCAPGAPRCAAGVGLAPDACGCCKVCARQLFDDCGEARPCDRTKGLECNFGGGYSSAKGICRAKSDGRTCEYSNSIYQNGEIFRPDCKHQCTCLDGAVGCVPLCPRQRALTAPRCAAGERVEAPGRCCRWPVCPEEAGKERRKAHGRADRKEPAPAWESNSLPGEQPQGEAPRGPHSSYLFDLRAAFGRHPTAHVLVRGAQCVPRTTAWSPCSRSCGTGVSTRATGGNGQCKPVKETRLCEVRPCKMAATQLKKGQTCNHVEEARRPVKLSHAGCRSLKAFQPRYCGSCSDGRCCGPHRTQTLPVHFRCKHGEILRRMVMVIQSCKCDLSCSGSSEGAPARHRHRNDVHRLKM